MKYDQVEIFFLAQTNPFISNMKKISYRLPSPKHKFINVSPELMFDLQLTILYLHKPSANYFYLVTVAWDRCECKCCHHQTPTNKQQSTAHYKINNTILSALPPKSTFNVSVNKCTVPAYDDSLFSESHIFHWPHKPAWLSDLQHPNSWLVCMLIFSWELL